MVVLLVRPSLITASAVMCSGPQYYGVSFLVSCRSGADIEAMSLMNLEQ